MRSPEAALWERLSGWSCACALSLLAPSAAVCQNYGGDWAITPTAQYTCLAFGFPVVQFSINKIQIAYGAPPNVTVRLLPTFQFNPLSGAFVTPNQIVASNVVPGGCTETYTVSLTFSALDRCTGSLVADLSGSCYGCTRQSFSITGTRLTFAAGSASFGAGWPGTSGVPGLSARNNPVVGSAVTVDVGNSLGAPTVGVLLLGVQQTSVPTVWGGNLLVVPLVAVPIGVPPGGASATFGVPGTSSSYGLCVHLQSLEADSGATFGVSFTPGLTLLLGS